MKRFILAFAFCAIVISVYAQTGGNNGDPIDFQVGWHDEGVGTIPIKRGPVCPPEAMLSGHTLYILTSHGDYDLQLLSSDGSVVYETFVPSTVNEVVFPSSLTGCFKLLLWAEPYVFIGEIEW